MIRPPELYFGSPEDLPYAAVIPPELALTTLDYLGSFPEVTGDEVNQLVAKFHASADRVAKSERRTHELFALLKVFNPRFTSKKYSDNRIANVLANVVAAIYAPIIHHFNHAVIRNIQAGTLPANIIAPPRDTVPFVNSLRLLASARSVDLKILQPYINRNTAGVPNPQGNKEPTESPHLEEYLRQMTVNISPGGSFTEIEPGIYSTLSPKVAKMLKKLGHQNLVALKLYGLGPNLSYVHGVLSDGKEWVAEHAEQKGLVDPKHIAALMILLDTIEELGMQNAIKSVENLRVNDQGKIEPIIVSNDEVSKEIAKATNRAVADTAKLYQRHDTEFIVQLLSRVPQMAKASRELDIPLTLQEIIPPDNKAARLAHFEWMKRENLLTYPEDLRL